MYVFIYIYIYIYIHTYAHIVTTTSYDMIVTCSSWMRLSMKSGCAVLLFLRTAELGLTDLIIDSLVKSDIVTILQ